jgi:hypothetical protein
LKNLSFKTGDLKFWKLSVNLSLCQHPKS